MNSIKIRGTPMIYLQLIESEDDKFKFETIYKQYRNLMFYVAFNLLGNEQDAEDVVHSAFLKIAENLQNLSEAICPKTKSYVVIVTENKAIDMLRQRNRHDIQPLDELPENYYSNIQPSAHSFIDTISGNSALAKCILALPPRYKEIILLKYYHGYNLHEIAKMLDITLVNAIKMNQRAKKKLKEFCKKEGLL